jgi:hypothetical protein
MVPEAAVNVKDPAFETGTTEKLVLERYTAPYVPILRLPLCPKSVENKLPPVTAVVPVYRFAFDNTSVPVPLFVKPNAADVPEITPPSFKVPEPTLRNTSELSVTVPVPESSVPPEKEKVPDQI